MTGVKSFVVVLLL